MVCYKIEIEKQMTESTERKQLNDKQNFPSQTVKKKKKKKGRVNKILNKGKYLKSYQYVICYCD